MAEATGSSPVSSTGLSGPARAIGCRRLTPPRSASAEARASRPTCVAELPLAGSRRSVALVAYLDNQVLQTALRNYRISNYYSTRRVLAVNSDQAVLVISRRNRVLTSPHRSSLCRLFFRFSASSNTATMSRRQRLVPTNVHGVDASCESPPRGDWPRGPHAENAGRVSPNWTFQRESEPLRGREKGALLPAVGVRSSKLGSDLAASTGRVLRRHFLVRHTFADSDTANGRAI